MTKATPADKKVLDRILNPDKKQALPTYRTELKKAEALADSFIKAIADAGRKIKSEDCSDRAMDYLDDLTGGRITTYTKKIDSLSRSFNIGSGLNQIGKLTSKVPNFEDMLCVTIPKFANLIIGVLEAALKLVNQLFKKIDKFRKKLEQTIAFFIQEIRNCIIKIIMDLSQTLDVVIENVTDLDALAPLLNKFDTKNKGCPCLREIILAILPKSWRDCDEEETGAGFIACLKDKIGSIGGGLQLLDGVNRWVRDNIINKFINTAFDALEDGINWVLEYIMKPFRYAIKQYCTFLNKALPAPFIGNPLPDCLFIHTKKKGKYRMSIIDYLNTAKLWVKCFQGICGTVSEDLKRKIKESNENLRLGIKHWLGSHEMDIYWSCISTTSSISDIEKKELWTSLFIDPFMETLDYIKAGREDLSREEPQPFDEEPEPDKPSIAESLEITNGADEEMFPVSKGHLKFYSGAVESAIIQIIKNLGSVINQHNYYERLNELLQWEQPLMKNQNHLDSIRGVRNRFGLDAEDEPVDELGNEFYTVLPTYLLRNDHSVFRSTSPPTKLDDESKVDYYGRWYTQTLNFNT